MENVNTIRGSDLASEEEQIAINEKAILSCILKLHREGLSFDDIYIVYNNLRMMDGSAWGLLTLAVMENGRSEKIYEQVKFQFNSWVQEFLEMVDDLKKRTDSMKKTN